MAYKSGEAYIQVTPSLTGWQAAIRQQLRDELKNAGFDVPIEPKTDPSQAPKDGDKYGSAFGDAARRRIDAALKDLPNPKIDADSSEADRKVAALRAKLEELRDKRLNLELSDAEFLAGVARVKAELDDLARRSPEVSVRVNAAAASAELAAFRAEVDQLDGRNLNLGIDTSRGISGINGLLLAGLALGPALIPVAAAITAAFGAIGTGAILGLGGLGTLGLAFSGVSGAVKELGKAHTATGKTAAQSAAQQLSAANAVTSAQEGVHSAEIGLLNAEDSLKRAREQAAAAEQNASVQVEAAIRRQRDAEQSLIDAQRSALRAQQALTQARQDAQRSLEDLSFSVQDNALAQRRARLDLAAAKDTLTKASASGTGVDTAQLGVDEARQRITELEAQGKRLAADKAAADKAGVDGSRQVTAAQDALVTANERVTQAQEQVRLSADAVMKAQVDGARQVAQANQAVIQGERAVELANQSVGAAVRGVAQAQAQQAASATQAAGKVDKLAEAMGKLSPAGQEFAHFIHDTLQLKLKELQATAQRGLLPGVEAGIRSALPQFGLLDQTVGIIAGTFGGLARDAGKALTDPFWTNFFGFIRDEAGPSTRTFGEILGNLAKGAAGLIQAFKPVWDDMGQGLLGLSQKFAHFGQDAGAGKSDSFNGFLQYVRDTWPQVKELFSQLLTLAEHLVQAFAGQGGSTLTLIIDVLKWINSLDPGTLRLLIDLFIAWKLFQVGAGVLNDLKKVYDTVKGIGTTLGDIRKGGGINGALGGGEAVAGAGAGLLVGGLAATGGSVAGGITASGQSPELKAKTEAAIKANPAPPGFERVGPTEYKASGFAGLNLGGIGDSLTRALQDARTKVNSILGGINGDAKTQFGQLNTTVSTQSKAASENAKAPWYANPGWFSGLWSSIWTGAGSWWGRISGTIGGWAGNTWTAVTGWFSRLGQWLGNTWNGMWQGARNVWSSIYTTITSVAQNTWNSVTGWFNRLGQDIANAWQWGIDRVRSIWNQLGNIAKIPVNFVIDPVYDVGIRGVWNTIAKTFGMGELPYVRPLAAGGMVPGPVAPMVTNRPTAIVGEGSRSHPEYVIPTDPKYRGRARSLWAQAGTQLMASGGILGAIESGWDWLGGMVTDPAGVVRRLFASVTSQVIPGVGALRDGLTKIPGKVVDAVIAKAKAWAAGVSATGGTLLGPLGAGQIFNAGQIVNTARVKGIPHAGAVIGIMTGLQESGLRVLANSNVPASLSLPHEGVGHDHDSVGIFQQRPSWGPLPVLMNPMGSASLFFNKLGRGPYGDYGAEAQRVQVSAFPGAYSKWRGKAEGLVAGAGYDQGGWLPPGYSTVFNGTGAPEPVIPRQELRLLRDAATSRRGDGIVNNWNVYETHDPADTARKILRRQELTVRTGAPL